MLPILVNKGVYLASVSSVDSRTHARKCVRVAADSELRLVYIARTQPGRIRVLQFYGNILQYNTIIQYNEIQYFVGRRFIRNVQERRKMSRVSKFKKYTLEPFKNVSGPVFPPQINLPLTLMGVNLFQQGQFSLSSTASLFSRFYSYMIET